MWNNWRQVPTWVCRSQPSPCQICFSLAQFRGWGGRDGLPFRTLFSNFNLHIIRGALPSSFQSIRPCITGKMQPKLLQSPLSQPKLKFALRFFWFAANRLKSPFLSDPGPIIVYGRLDCLPMSLTSSLTHWRPCWNLMSRLCWKLNELTLVFLFGWDPWWSCWLYTGVPNKGQVLFTSDQLR